VIPESVFAVCISTWAGKIDGSMLQYPVNARVFVLQCVALCCSVCNDEYRDGAQSAPARACVAVCCSVLQCVAVCCSVL